VIQAAAYEYGIPAEVLAGVAYKEVGGKPMWIDDAVDWARQHGPRPGRPDDTSYGPTCGGTSPPHTPQDQPHWAVQVDTAAGALGYDPAHLTDRQRDEIVASLKDPKQNIMTTTKVLADARDTTDLG
jgi:hypothetical protein